jgi:hypothetical protein
MLVAMLFFLYIKSYKLMFEKTFQPHRTEEDFLTTICEKCGKQFLTGEKLPSEKIPWHCSGCGNNLTWSFPYTRVQIEYYDGTVVQAKNLIHSPGWVNEMKLMVDSELDKNVESINVIIKKKVILE